MVRGCTAILLAGVECGFSRLTIASEDSGQAGFVSESASLADIAEGCHEVTLV